MPLTAGTTTATATATTIMTANSHRSGFAATSTREQTPENTSSRSASPDNNYVFDESECLFCNQNNSSLDQNLHHMSKAHGLHVETTNLVVDIASLLEYFHLIISECYECLYCGTQRNTRQAVQQHMMAKGHCKYDIMDDDADLRDFYDFSSSSEAKDELNSRLSSDAQVPSQTRSRRRTRPSTRSERPEETGTAASPLDQALPNSNTSSSSNSTASSRSNSASRPSSTSPSPSSRELSTRALKQEHTLNTQLSQLRAEDRRSLAHLPTSQQRALLATHHKQTEKARRSEQTQRGHLESAGNHFGRLSTIRLIRKPPHTGNVYSLNR